MSALLDRPRLTVPVTGRDHTIGPETAPVVLLEYGDYECPFCGAAHHSLKQLFHTVGDEVLYAFRHFPLTQIHLHAQQAAEAAEAAGAQNRFWQMHNMLFEHQDRLGADHLLGYAEALGLDVERFASDLSTHRHAPRIREDFLTGIRSGVNGTPTFFVNGIRHNGGYDTASLLAAIEAAV
jgi:protein-disulfide isomerase